MVDDDSKHSFRKLRLDTRQTNPHASSSSFASFAHDNQSVPTRNDPQPDHGAYSSQVSSELSTDDLLGTLNQDGAQNTSHSWQQPGGNNHSPDGNKHLPDANAGDAAPRDRGASVSFSSHATLDGGMQHALADPLPKVGSTRGRGPSITGSSQGDSNTPATPGSAASPRINPFTGEPIRRRTRRSDMPPRLESIESAQGQVPSLTSESTSSPSTEPFNSPQPKSMTGSLVFSPGAMPSAALSPTPSSEPWPMSGRESFKSRSQSRQASLINNSFGASSRRSSRMSGSSPASAFLSRWGQGSMASLAPEPDEEGQAIGVQKDFVIGRQIGYGGFSVVKELHSLTEEGQKITKTVKIVRKNIPSVSEAENDKLQLSIEHEIDIWRTLKHENVLSLHSVYHTDFATFCVMDLIEGGTLFDLVRKTRTLATKGLTINLVKHYAYQLASALRYLHEDAQVVHRDVKLENCLLVLTEQDAEKNGGKLKLCDFGLADYAKGEMFDSVESLDLADEPNKNGTTEVIGTLQYAAPESFTSSSQTLRSSLDMWAFGCCLYTMITGDMPFSHALQSRVIENISNGLWDREAVRSSLATHEDADHIMRVLDGCLEVDAAARWTVSDVLTSSWLENLQSAEGDGWDTNPQPHS